MKLKTVKILLSEYEANKSDFFFNILKWLFIFIPIIFLIILSINVFGDVGTQYLTTGTTIYNTNDASTTVYCQGIKVNTTSIFQCNRTMVNTTSYKHIYGVANYEDIYC